ncbi:hypothetical protein CISIN_1g032779mg [Citrus sinensis]|uniref:Uncharacterized protein n=1 Tax=Citrus sinensis TaxID=2711 RepID=A0A067DMY5_CITSI|nr:hypothetical protein CISIN_1g032779mg [Citrus sinensis]KDO39977.1 hypothetical protein CISIN_1g032779mg [Citrus sinensis]
MFEKLWDHLHFEAALLFTWHLEEDLLTAPASCWHGLQIAFIEMHLGLDLAQKSHANKKLDPQTTLLKESCRSDGHGENDEDEESESRTSTFEKKRLVPPTSLLQALKKQKLLVMLSRLNLWICVIIELESDTCV